jgi:hypothetical protein
METHFNCPEIIEICRIRTHFQTKIQLFSLLCQSDYSEKINQKSLKRIKKKNSRSKFNLQAENPIGNFRRKTQLLFWKVVTVKFSLDSLSLIFCLTAYRFAVTPLVREGIWKINWLRLLIFLLIVCLGVFIYKKK